jgi:hypothetical protein
MTDPDPTPQPAGRGWVWLGYLVGVVVFVGVLLAVWWLVSLL